MTYQETTKTAGTNFRRLRGDMIEVYKILSGNMTRKFVTSYQSNTIAQVYQLKGTK